MKHCKEFFFLICYYCKIVFAYIVLEDLIHAFHPDLLPDYKPTYYELLK